MTLQVGHLHSLRGKFNELVLEKEVFHLLMNQKNMTVNFTQYWNMEHLIKDVEQGILDMTLNWFSVSHALYHHLLFPYPLTDSERVFIVPITTHGMFYNTYDRLVNVFQPTVWICVLVTIVLINIFVLLAKRITNKLPLTRWQFVSVVLSQDSAPARSPRHHDVIWIGCTALFTLFTLSLYQNLLLTQLLHSDSVKIRIENLGQLLRMVQSKQVKVGFSSPRSSVYQELLNSNTTPSLQMQQALLANPPFFRDEGSSDSLWNPFVEDAEGNSIIIVDITDPHRGLQRIVDKRAACRLRMISAVGLEPIKLTFAISPFRPDLREYFNKRIMHNFELIQGMITFRTLKLTHALDRCKIKLDEELNSDMGTSLDLTELLGCFIFLAGGILFASLAYVWEQFSHKLNTSDRLTIWSYFKGTHSKTISISNTEVNIHSSSRPENQL